MTRRKFGKKAYLFEHELHIVNTLRDAEKEVSFLRESFEKGKFNYMHYDCQQASCTLDVDKRNIGMCLNQILDWAKTGRKYLPIRFYTGVKTFLEDN
jgi:hypothetical protein